MKRISFTLLIAICSLCAFAQTAFIEKDFLNYSFSGAPGWFTEAGGKLYMYATDTAYGTELWVKNGSSPISMVADITPGKQGSSNYSGDYDYRMGVAGNTIIFPCSSDIALFKYDGTSAPSRVTSFTASRPLAFLSYGGGKIYFTGEDATKGQQLWVYDNATGIATVLTTIPGPGWHNIGELFPYKNKLYFSAIVGFGYGDELYCYDIATGNLNLVADLNTASSTTGSFPGGFFEYNSKMYFWAENGKYLGKRVLFEYDGINPPVNIRDTTGYMGGDPSTGLFGKNAVIYKGKYYSCFRFSGHSNIFSYDLTTKQIQNLQNLYSENQWFIIHNNKLIFDAYTTSVFTKSATWVYDGVAPAKLYDTTVMWPDRYTEYNGSVYFIGVRADTPSTELFRLGWPAGVEKVATISPLALYPNPAKNTATLAMILQQAATVHIRITNMEGKEVMHSTHSCHEGKQNITIDIASLAPGTYSISVADNTHTYGTTILVKH